MQPDEVPVFGIHQRDLYIATLLIIFGGIGKQVVENLVQLVRIKITDNRLRITEYGEMYLALFDKRQERFGFIFHKRRHISWRDTQLQIAGFCFTKFKNLLQQTDEPADIATHYRIKVVMPGKPHLQLIDGSRDNGQRSQQFMRDICKELQFGMIQFFQFGLLHLPKMQLITQLHPVLCCPENEADNSCPYQCINDISPPCSPERWQYHHLKFTDFLTPNAIFIGGFQTEPISTALQIIIIGKTAVGIRILPILVKTYKLISIPI